MLQDKKVQNDCGCNHFVLTNGYFYPRTGVFIIILIAFSVKIYLRNMHLSFEKTHTILDKKRELELPGISIRELVTPNGNTSESLYKVKIFKTHSLVLRAERRNQKWFRFTLIIRGIIMKRITKKKLIENGLVERESKDLYSLLNLNYLKLTNKTHTIGEYSFPILYCSTDIIPDYLALYTQPSDYHHTTNTCVCFYAYDNTFDGIFGLFNAIYYDNKELLSCYKERFKNVKFFISPDYSQFGDLQEIENIHRLWKARIVTLWFIVELHAIAIPNTTYVSRESFPLYFSGLEECQVIAFSTKGHMRTPAERELLIDAVKYAVDHLPLKTIIVYSVCGDDNNTFKLFEYAISKGIRVVIPNNSLRERNRGRCSV